MNFADLDENFRDFARSRVMVVPIPYEKTTSYMKGTQKGPDAILKSSRNIELFDYETGINAAEKGIYTTDPISCDSALELIEKTKEFCRFINKKNKFPIFLGGEHTISIGPVLAFKEYYKELSVLCFDAHLDLRDKFEEKYSHACVMRRINEKGVGVSYVGVRSCCEEEIEFVKNNKLKVQWDNVYDVKKLISSLKKNVYISIDLDVLDPSVMPAVGTPEPGGLGWYELLEILKEVFRSRKIVGADVVELCPIENLEYPNLTASKLVYKLITYDSINQQV
ncbi:agmatinase [Candidatus Micrarchaeota archaeon]|nr:agmatinase [Candidatus Micrarchaeota archaeon]